MKRRRRKQFLVRLQCSGVHLPRPGTLTIPIPVLFKLRSRKDRGTEEVCRGEKGDSQTYYVKEVKVQCVKKRVKIEREEDDKTRDDVKEGGPDTEMAA
ncbi:hypothetical protein E2C01_084519 [Portunus trituberculatus]|uniref:Uncharacterized protein n=1 Tax=Portunus trituberculatus TaxID=210409 RepID=A0A5B7J479_PORTR|nr:hypothetical protein [Portunus trituberculatus]